jgi:hypothetical protein
MATQQNGGDCRAMNVMVRGQLLGRLSRPVAGNEFSLLGC